MGQELLHRIVSDEQMLELCIRVAAEECFEELLKDELGGEELQALKRLFFHFLYRLKLGGRMPG